MNTLEVRPELIERASGSFVLLAAMLVDGEPVADFGWFATWLLELQRSVREGGKYFLLTCWCGMPECAGICEPVRVIHEFDAVRWEITQPEPPRVFTFEATAYREAVAEGLAAVKREVSSLEPGSGGALSVILGMEHEAVLREVAPNPWSGRRHHGR